MEFADIRRSLRRPRSSQQGTAEWSAAHLVGVRGSGMAALAELLLDMGWRVTGSDLKAAPCVSDGRRSMGGRQLTIHQGHHADLVTGNLDVVVYSQALSASNPELRAARARGIPCLTYAAMLGRLMQTRTGIAIAGTHGKSTTAALVGTILESAGLSPAVVVGAESIVQRRSGWVGSGDLIVVEACEFGRSFLELPTSHGVILGIEHDHVDCFPTTAACEAAFSQFAEGIPDSGSLLINGDCRSANSAADATAAPVITFGFSGAAHWRARSVRSTRTGCVFRVLHRNQEFGEFQTSIPGRHNVANALAAIATAAALGVTAPRIRTGLAAFAGIRRRCEFVGTWRGVSLIDDYAHHPTAVRATLTWVRQRFPGRHIWCVFEPHQISRTRYMLDELSSALAVADRVSVVPVFAARETAESSDSAALSSRLARSIQAAGRPAGTEPALDRAITTLDDEACAGDVIVIMGAGRIDQVRYEFSRRLQQNHSAQ